MGRLIMFNLVSLDGFFAGPNGEIDWFQTDDEFDHFAIEQTAQAKALVFGRVTYELMASFWPTDEAAASEPEIADLMNALPKTVFSRTLRSPGRTRGWSDDAAGEIARLKRETVGDIYLFGSADLAETLTAAGLFDEYRVIVNPVVLGAARRSSRLTGGSTSGSPRAALRQRQPAADVRAR